MKRIFILFFSVISTYSFGQSKLLEPLSFTEIFKLDSISANDLYDRAFLWVHESFNNPDKVMTLNDKELGMIKLKPLFTVNDSRTMVGGILNGIVYLEINIAVKDGKAKIDIGPFEHKSNKSFSFGIVSIDSVLTEKRWGSVPLKSQQKAYEVLHQKIKLFSYNLILSFGTTILKPVGKNEDW